jgi:hypothetical protein
LKVWLMKVVSQGRVHKIQKWKLTQLWIRMVSHQLMMRKRSITMMKILNRTWKCLNKDCKNRLRVKTTLNLNQIFHKIGLIR